MVTLYEFPAIKQSPANFKNVCIYVGNGNYSYCPHSNGNYSIWWTTTAYQDPYNNQHNASYSIVVNDINSVISSWNQPNEGGFVRCLSRQ